MIFFLFYILCLVCLYGFFISCIECFYFNVFFVGFGGMLRLVDIGYGCGDGKVNLLVDCFDFELSDYGNWFVFIV